MNGFRKPERRAQGGYTRLLYADGDQASNSLSAFLGGDIEQATSTSTEEANKGLDISGELGVSGVKAGGGGSRNRRLVYEEEVIRKKTGYSTISSLLRKLHEISAIGPMSTYGPDEYEQIEEGELYEIKGKVRMHPFHQVIDITSGWEEANQNLREPQEAPEFGRMVSDIKRAMYGRNRPSEAYAVFVDIEGSPPEYKLVMAIKEEQLLVPLDEFSGKANFVVQIHRKIEPGRKYSVAHLVRSVAMVAPPEEKLLLDLVPILQGLPGVEEEGITVSADDVVLREPAVILKPLCIYKG